MMLQTLMSYQLPQVVKGAFVCRQKLENPSFGVLCMLAILECRVSQHLVAFLSA